MRTIEEVLEDGSFRRFVHPEWAAEFPWLTQGTTDAAGGFDLRLFGVASEDLVRKRWETLRESLGFRGVAHARQVHGVTVLGHSRDHPTGLTVKGEADGHVTGPGGPLLAVTVADCVPVFIVDPVRRTIALLHAGWRGAAQGILAAGLSFMNTTAGSQPEDVHVHAGPSICGACYEVGPEVHGALGLTPPQGPTPIDLRAVLARQARDLGVLPGRTTRSAHCTRCAPDVFYSHRAGAAGRQVGLLGIAEVS